MKKISLTFALLAAGVAPVLAQSVSLTTLSYAQDFNGLAATTLSATTGTQVALNGASGWEATRLSGTGATAMPFTIDNGASNTGGIFSYGATAAADRALGALASGANIPTFGASFTNNTGATITQFTLSFTAEFWRSSTLSQNVLTFGYGILDGVTFTAGNYLTAGGANAFAGLNVVGPVAVASNGALDGNLPGNQASLTAAITGLNLQAGQTLFIRWQDANDTGNDAGLAIDSLNMTFSAIPEPSTYAMIAALGVFGVTALRRRRNARA